MANGTYLHLQHDSLLYLECVQCDSHINLRPPVAHQAGLKKASWGVCGGSHLFLREE